MRETITHTKVVLVPTARCRVCGAHGRTRDAIFLVSRSASRCGPDSVSTPECFNNFLKTFLLNWNFFTNEDFFNLENPSSSLYIWKPNFFSGLINWFTSNHIYCENRAKLYNHTADSENAQRNRKKRENLKVVKFAPTRCQNLSISRINRL